IQARRGARPGDPHAFHADYPRGLRDYLRRALWPWSLQNARHDKGGQPGRVRQVAGGTGGGEAITWLPGNSLHTKLTHTRHLKDSFASGFSVSIIKSSGFSTIFWR